MLHRGAVVEEGTHEELISAHDDLQEPPIGSYAQLANLGPCDRCSRRMTRADLTTRAGIFPHILILSNTTTVST